MSDSWHINFYRRPLSKEPSGPVTARMLLNAGIGQTYWGASTRLIPETAAYRIAVETLIGILHIDDRLGRGAIFSGEFGTGKTSCGAIMLKAGMARGGQAYMVNALELREAHDRGIFHLTPEGLQVWDMACCTQLVVLDDLGAEIAPGIMGSDTRVAEEMIRRRYNNRLTTYVTTNMDRDTMLARYKGIASILEDKNRFHHVPVVEVHWRGGK